MRKFTAVPGKGIFAAEAAADDYLAILEEGIRRYNSRNDGHITTKGDSFRYASYEKDYYEYGRLSDAAQQLAKYEQEVTDGYELADFALDALGDAAKDATSAHHAFEVSEMNAEKRQLDAKYGFGYQLTDKSYRLVAQNVLDCIYELAEKHGIKIYKRIDVNDNTGWHALVTVKPKARTCTIRGYYSGVFIYIATPSNDSLGLVKEQGRNPGYKRLKQLVIANIDDIEAKSGASNMKVSQNITFTY